MKKAKKTWHKKFYIWIGIVAGICTIITFIFDMVSYTNSGIVMNSNNKINASDQSKIIMGDNNNIINYGNLDTDNIQDLETNDFSVAASFDTNVNQSSLSGIDVLIKATTSFAADHVTISAISDEAKTESFDMYGGTYTWYFKANFYIKGTYTITITAYNSEGESVSDSFKFTY